MWNGRRLTAYLVYVLAVTCLLYVLFGSYTYDDPFITFRYARNLADGNGLVYNPGQRVLSTSTPLFTLVLAGLSLVWDDIPHLANLLGIISLAVGALCLWKLANLSGRPMMGWTALLLYPSFPLVLNTLSSEMPLYICLGLAGFVFYELRKPYAAAICAGLMAVTRPDGFLIGLVFVVYAFTRWMAVIDIRHASSAVIWRSILCRLGPVIVFVAITGAWYCFAWWYYGLPVPVTLMAKQAQGSMQISQQFLPGVLTVWQVYILAPYGIAILVFTLIGLMVVLRSRNAFAVLLIWTLLYICTYIVLGVSRYFWYYAPVVPAIIVLVGLGLSAICRWAREHVPIGQGNLPAIFAGVCLLGLVYGQYENGWLLHLHADLRMNIYRAVGEWINSNVEPTVQIGSLEVGAIGYYSHRTMIDFAGLIQPEVAQQITPATTYQDTATWAISRYRPGIVVLRDGAFPRLEQTVLQAECHGVKKFEGVLYGYDGNITVYGCP